jgi:hypothetical protein
MDTMHDTETMKAELTFYSEIKEEQRTNIEIRTKKIDKALDAYISL